MENYMLDDIKEYLSLNLNDYGNININFEINKFILLCAVAMCAFSFFISYKRSILADTVKQLLRHNATDEESAKTLGELGLADSRGIRNAIFTSAQLRRMITVVGECRPTYEEYVAAQKEKKKLDEQDPLAVRIYIPEEAMDRARYVYNTYSSSVSHTLLACVMFISLAVCLILVMPELLTMIDNSLAA